MNEETVNAKKEIETDPTKVTENDLKSLYTKLKILTKIVNRNRKYNIHEVSLEESMISHKPKIRARFIAKFSGHNNSVAEYDNINYVLGDQDLTWDRLLEWLPKLEVRAGRVKRGKERTRRIAKKIGDEDLLWFLQVTLVGARVYERLNGIDQFEGMPPPLAFFWPILIPMFCIVVAFGSVTDWGNTLSTLLTESIVRLIKPKNDKVIDNLIDQFNRKK